MNAQVKWKYAKQDYAFHAIRDTLQRLAPSLITNTKAPRRALRKNPC